MVTVTGPETLGTADRAEGGAGAMGRLGIVGFRGCCGKTLKVYLCLNKIFI